MVTLIAVASIISSDPSLHESPLPTSAVTATACALLLQSLALLLKPRAPIASLLIIAALPISLAFIEPNGLFTVTVVPVVVTVFLVAAHGSVLHTGRQVLLAVPLVAIGQFINSFRTGHPDVTAAIFEAFAQAIVVVAMAFLPAAVLASQRATLLAQNAEVRALTRERDAQIGEAVALERTAMARELHDIAAHHLSGISLMAAAIARQVESDPAAARDGALHVRRQSKLILQDLRRLVGLLRIGEDDGQIKTLSTIRELVGSVRAAGSSVNLDIRFAPNRPLGHGVGPLGHLAAYRMVQETLTNALKHAPGAHCQVLIDDRDTTTVEVSVSNSPAESAAKADSVNSGLGILGMRERAILIGGSFDTGPTPEGGWSSTMILPREDDSKGNNPYGNKPDTKREDGR
ncbi:sensor histidine kinase [Brevibacterium aurantiacum]|uniref:sensor histidine kinase n=1 Tax=Brevibacterium aurantiacum TaxID=273384 RepID=UPI0016434F79|nr:histidine kinase [Brevibacterium aurantiacum]